MMLEEKLHDVDPTSQSAKSHLASDTRELSGTSKALGTWTLSALQLFRSLYQCLSHFEAESIRIEF